MVAWPDKCRDIYEHLQDNISRKMFLARVNYSVTGDDAFWMDLAQMNLEAERVYHLPKQKAYIFGAGVYGEHTRKYIPMDWMGYIDNDNQKRGGIAMVSLCSRRQMFRVMR